GRGRARRRRGVGAQPAGRPGRGGARGGGRGGRPRAAVAAQRPPCRTGRRRLGAHRDVAGRARLQRAVTPQPLRPSTVTANGTPELLWTKPYPTCVYPGSRIHGSWLPEPSHQLCIQVSRLLQLMLAPPVLRTTSSLARVQPLPGTPTPTWVR